MNKKKIRRLKMVAVMAMLEIAAIVLVPEFVYRTSLFLKAKFGPGGGAAFDIYVVGGSSAYGAPYPAEWNFSSVAAEMLGNEIDGRPVRVRTLARGGRSIYPQALRLRKTLKYRSRRNPAAVFLYSGHNELFTAPTGNRSGQKAAAFIRMRIVRWSLFWSDVWMRIEERLERYGYRDMRHYETYLRMAIEDAQRSGAVVVIATLVSNLADLEPHEPSGRSWREIAVQKATARILGAGLKLEETGRLKKAQEFYRSALLKEPALKRQLLYRIGKIHLARGEVEKAREHLWKAHDADGFERGRATRAQNELLRRLAREYGLALVESELLFDKASTRGVPGGDLIIDTVHPNRKGVTILGKAFAEALARRLGIEAPEGSLVAKVTARHIDLGNAGEFFYETSFFLLERSLSHPGPHVFPRDRLRFTKKMFKRAVKLDPGNATAHIGLAYTNLLIASGFPVDYEKIEWGRRVGLFPVDPCRMFREIDAIADAFFGFGLKSEARTVREFAGQDEEYRYCH